VFFGYQIHLSVDLSAETDVTGRFAVQNYSLDIGGHNFFQDIIRNINVIATYEKFDPFNRECEMTLHGSANIHNPFPLHIDLLDAGFLVELHDNQGEEPFFPPLDHDHPILVGSAAFVPPQKITKTVQLHSWPNPSLIAQTLGAKLASAANEQPQPMFSSSGQMDQADADPNHDMRAQRYSQPDAPIQMWLKSYDYETCVRAMATQLRKDIVLDLLQGFVTIRFMEKDYKIAWQAFNVRLL